MRKTLMLLSLLLLFACKSSAQQTTYNFNWTEPTPASDSSGSSLIMNVPDINTTHMDIVTLTLANGCGSDQVYSYDAATVTGPALVVGEWVKVVVSNLPGYSGDFQITALGTDASGNPDFTVNHLSCFTGGSGQAWAGPSADPFFVLSNFQNGVCNSSQSVFHFTLLHTDGTLSNETSTAGAVTCTSLRDSGGTVTITAEFSSTLTTGESVTGTFTTSGYIACCRGPLSGHFIALTAAWSITSPTPIDTLVPGGTGGGGHPGNFSCGAGAAHC